MVFCAYCGKSFTRKEHLERHIPSHTNVKPHRCSACQLSFARRDLLQRHHATYHEARDPVEPLPGVSGAPGSTSGCGAVATVAGRTPIACQNCANAKTGCDKRVPCARCAEKSLPCAARFARRSSKAAVRGGSGSGGTLSTGATTPAVPLTPTYADLAQCPLPPAYYHHHHHPQNTQALSFADACGLPPQPLSKDTTGPYDLCLAAAADPTSAGNESLQQASPLGMDGTWAAQYRNIDDSFGGGYGYPDLVWADYPPMLGLGTMDMDTDMDAAAAGLVDDCMHLYANPLQLSFQDMAAPAAPAAPTAPMAPDPFLAQASSSDVSPGSEPMTASSSSWASSPMHTRGTSILSWNGSGGSGGGGCGDAGEYGHGGYGETMRLFLPPQALAVVDQALTNGTVTATVMPDEEKRSALPVEPAATVDNASEASMEDTSTTDNPGETAWPLARCMPVVVGARPHTREAVLQLQRQLRTGAADLAETADTTDVSVVPLTPQGHDALGAVLYAALHRALAMHNCRVDAKRPLPPSSVLDVLLRAGVHSLAQNAFDPLFEVDPNTMLLDNHSAQKCLVLLLLAQGAAATSNSPLSADGLAEVGRIAFDDMASDGGALRTDTTMLCCEFISTQLGAWSGDAVRMDAALGRRSTALRMLQHADLLEAQPAIPGPSTDIEQTWQTWRQQEAKNRWVLADQELCLFHDTAPGLSVDALRCPLPCADVFWRASSASSWQAAVEANNDSCSPPSLRTLFHAFLHDPETVSGNRPALSHQHLRLLLYPLQGLVFQLRQMLSTFHADDEEGNKDNTSNGALSQKTVLQQLKDVKALLHRWSTLATLSTQSPNEDQEDSTTRARVLYHAVALAAMVDVPEIEGMARRRDRRQIFSADRREVVGHCGHVLRLLRQMPINAQPAWWSLALYRAVLILWADRVWENSDQNDDNNDDNDNDRDGAPKTPAAILRDGAERLGQGRQTRLRSGLRRKLLALNQSWEGIDTQ